MCMETISRKFEWISGKLAYLGAAALLVMMLLTTADVAGRYIFNHPILGAFELTEFMVLILIFSFLAQAQSRKSHVSVDLFLSRLPKRVRVFIGLFNHTVCFVLIALIAWMSAVRAFELKVFAEASSNLHIPKYPFAFFVVIGCVVLCLEYIRDLIRLGKEKGKGMPS